MFNKQKNLAIILIVAIAISFSGSLLIEKAIAAYLDPPGDLGGDTTYPPPDYPGENIYPPIYSDVSGLTSKLQAIRGGGAKLRIDGVNDSSELQLLTNNNANHWAVYANINNYKFNIWNGDNLLTIDSNYGYVGIGNDQVGFDGRRLIVAGSIKANEVDVGAISSDSAYISGDLNLSGAAISRINNNLNAGGDLTVGVDTVFGNDLSVNQDAYFSGKVGIGVESPEQMLEIAGVFTATQKNFRISHPSRENYDLVHSVLEGPEAAVFYRGEARLENGRATVKLPDYFEALTREEGRTVQLSSKGEEIFLLSASDVVDGKFTVYGEKQDGEFSWEVKAVRDDVPELDVEQLRIRK